ncbi:MAG: histidinol-phosphatase [Chloroflexota bacterium]
MYRIDCHVHPDYSPDAEGQIREYCQQAVRIGLNALCFTTHVDLCDEPVVVVAGEPIPSSDRRWLAAYCQEVETARSEFAGLGLKVLTGVEADYFPGCERPLRDLLDGARLDYVMGSVHYLGQHVLTRRFSAEEYYRTTDVAEMARRYFEAVAAAATSGLFDAIGHIDIYRRFGEPIYGPPAAMIHRDYAQPALRAIADAGVGIEINTSSIRRGAREVYPGADLLEMCRKSGIRFVTIGSDAHSVDVLGSGLDAGYAALAAAGYDAVCTYEDRRPVAHALHGGGRSEEA